MAHRARQLSLELSPQTAAPDHLLDANGAPTRVGDWVKHTNEGTALGARAVQVVALTQTCVIVKFSDQFEADAFKDGKKLKTKFVVPPVFLASLVAKTEEPADAACAVTDERNAPVTPLI